jgi:hypothetical protein
VPQLHASELHRWPVVQWWVAGVAACACVGVLWGPGWARRQEAAAAGGGVWARLQCRCSAAQHAAGAAPSHTARHLSLPPPVWVWCGDPKLCGSLLNDCWLKHLAHPWGTAPAKEGADVGWTTGIMTPKVEPAQLGVSVGQRVAARAGVCVAGVEWRRQSVRAAGAGGQAASLPAAPAHHLRSRAPA